MYYIYHIPNFVFNNGSVGKIGCTDNLKRRMNANKNISNEPFDEWEVLEEHNCEFKASEREIELQKQYGYKVDKVPYWKTIEAGSIEASIKGGTQNVKSGHLSKIQKGRKRPILQFDLNDNFIKEWSSSAECASELGIDKSNLSKLLNHHKWTKTLKGYKFKFK